MIARTRAGLVEARGGVNVSGNPSYPVTTQWAVEFASGPLALFRAGEK